MHNTRAHGHTYLLSFPTHPVPLAGSLWDPNITVETLDTRQLRVNFTLWNESTPYQILLESFPHSENQSCFDDIQQIPAVPVFPAPSDTDYTPLKSSSFLPPGPS